MTLRRTLRGEYISRDIESDAAVGSATSSWSASEIHRTPRQPIHLRCKQGDADSAYPDVQWFGTMVSADVVFRFSPSLIHRQQAGKLSCQRLEQLILKVGIH